MLLLISYRNSRIALICNISYTKNTAQELKSSCRNERTHSQNALPDRRALQIHALCSFRVWFEILFCQIHFLVFFCIHSFCSSLLERDCTQDLCIYLAESIFACGGGALVKHNCAKRVISTLPSTGICTMTICTRHSVKWFPIGRGRTCCSRRLAEGIQSFSYGENPMKRDALSRNPARVHVGWRLDNHAHGLPYERDISSAHSSFGR